MKLITLCFCLIAIVPQIGQTSNQAIEDSKNPKRDSREHQTPAQKIGTPTVVNPNSPTNLGNEGTGRKKKDDPVSISTVEPINVRADIPKDWMDKLNWVFTGILVAIGGCGVWYAKNTLDTIKNQIDEMKAAGKQTVKMLEIAGVQAEAARLSAESIVNSGRASVIVSRLGGPENGWYWPDMPQYIPGMVFEFQVLGNTPARITDARFYLLTVPAKSGPIPDPDLPPIPDYFSRARSPEIPEDGRVIAHGQTFQIRLGLPNIIMTLSEWENLRDKKTLMCAYGCIWYRDSFGRDRETAVCYVYRFHHGVGIHASDGTRLDPPGFEIGGGLPVYNRST
jgi:hypothetical protein